MSLSPIRSDTPFVILGLDREVFAVPVETVVEILDMRPMFRVPDAPAHLAGLIDVRGRGVPVVDLRVKLGLPAVPPTETTRIIVLDVHVDGRRLIGRRGEDFVVVFDLGRLFASEEPAFIAITETPAQQSRDAA
jgi:purine-binding chemotaxis protein CheW